MKTMNRILSALLTLSPAVALAAANGVVYERDGASSEYPPAFRVKKNVILKGTNIPELNPKRDVGCDFSKGQELVFVKAEKTVTQTYQTAQLKLLKDVQWDLFTPRSPGNPQQVTLKKGTVVEDVSYLAEGFCDVRVNGKIYEATCFSNGGQEDEFQKLRDLEQETFALFTCGAGWKAWFSEPMLSESSALESFFYNPY